MSQPEFAAANALPLNRVDVPALFGINTPWPVAGFAQRGPLVPELDPHYVFDAELTLALLAGFAHDRRVLVHGPQGTGKSTHIEQIAARLNWPCLRINLDGHIARIDLVGRDAIVIRDGKQITEFQEGMLPWALRNGVALVLDEYDAGRPDVMFVLQRLLEAQSRLVLLEQQQVVLPHPSFRLFATANTLGLGDATGQFQGTVPINQAQLDRWQLIASLGWPQPATEQHLLRSRVPSLADASQQQLVCAMVELAGLLRLAHAGGQLAVAMSPRTLLHWAENMALLGDRALALRLSYLNRCDPAEWPLVAELYQRCFGSELIPVAP